jgi:hypothetical protein
MRTHLLRNMFIVGSAALALAASAVALPSVADAAGHTTRMSSGAGHGHARVGGNFRGRGGHGRYGGYGGYRGYSGAGYVGGYDPGFCGPIQLTLGLCGPWGY